LNEELTSASLCVAERFPVIALEPFALLTVFDNFSLLCLPPVFLLSLVSVTVAPFFAALSSFFGAFAVSFASAYFKQQQSIEIDF
jgi:hypothetical protein